MSVVKYHVNPKTGQTGKCSATVQDCKFAENGVLPKHYSSEQEARMAYEKVNDNNTVKSLKKSNIVTTAIVPMAKGAYYGSKIDKKYVQSFRDKLKDYLGKEDFEKFEKNKASRDRGYHYHATVLTPPEMRQHSYIVDDIPENTSFEFKGIGYAEDNGNEAYFIVCENDELNDWRESNGLPRKDFHITLGFNGKDVHSKPKDDSSIIKDL